MGKHKPVECCHCEEDIARKDTVKIPKFGRVCKTHTELISKYTNKKAALLQQRLDFNEAEAVSKNERLSKLAVKIIEDQVAKDQAEELAEREQEAKFMVIKLTEQLRVLAHTRKVTLSHAKDIMKIQFMESDLDNNHMQYTLDLLDKAWKTASKQGRLTVKEIQQAKACGKGKPPMSKAKAKSIRKVRQKQRKQKRRA